MLKQRIITALFLIPIVLWTIFASNEHYFAGLMALIIVLAAMEWGRLIKLTSIAYFAYASINLLIIVMVYILDAIWVHQVLLISSCLFWTAAIGIVIAYQKQKMRLPKSKWTLMLLGQLLLVSAWDSLYYLKMQESAVALLFLMLLIWSADSGAYFAGKAFGKNKFASNVSPGKTWEGIYGGLVAALIVGLVYVMVMSENIYAVFFFTIVTVIFSITGDLFESILKREVDIKDSGNILPGHGGVLDRIDSLIAASPVFALANLMMVNI